MAFNIPTEVQRETTEYRQNPLLAPFSPSTVTPAGDDLDNAIGIIAAARRPIVPAGRGPVDDEARDALVRLAGRIDAPIATSLKAKGLFRGIESNLGVFGTLSTPAAVDAILRSDCVVSFGASLTNYTTSNGTFLNGKRVVQVSRTADDLGRWHIPDVGLFGGVVETVDVIIHWLDEAGGAPSGFLQELEDRAPAAPVPTQPDPADGPFDFVDALVRLNQMLPRDRTLVIDYGRFMVKTLQHIDVPSPRHLLTTGNFGSIGLGMSYAVGAGAAEPGRPVVLFVGDGGFMLGGLAEFNAAVRHGVELIVVVCNDGSYGVEHMQLRDKQMDPSLVMFDWPDFAPLAVALGGRGVTVRSSADFAKAREAIVAGGAPLLIDLKLSPDHMPAIRVDLY